MILIEKSHILQRLKRLPEALEILTFITELDANNRQNCTAQYEECIGCALLFENRTASAEIHRRRSERMFTALRCRPGLAELSRRSSELTPTEPGSPSPPASGSIKCFSPGNAIQGVAALLMYSGRPALVAPALIDLLAVADCTTSAAITTGLGGERHTIFSIGELEGRRPENLPMRLPSGPLRTRSTFGWNHGRTRNRARASARCYLAVLDSSRT